MKMKFDVANDFLQGIDRLSNILDYNTEKEILVKAEKSDKNGIVLKNGEAVIYYTHKSYFFRALGILIDKIKTMDSFECFEDSFFKTISTMICVSRNNVLKVSSIKETLDYLAVMGYNQAMLYTEDLIALENYEYFGYMRGRYTKEDLKEIDDYAYEYGIEMVPCIECYGHMGKYLIWPEAAPIKDTAKILLAREQKTFEFLDEYIKTISSCYRSNRIHIGMDEAWDMGRGQFLDKNGYVAPIDIFNEFMEELIKITDKYNLIPMMWSDMYFRASSKEDGNAYYLESTNISEETKKKIPENVDLVFWHYGEAFGCDDYMLKKHNELGRNVIFAGGAWDWSGHFPEHNYAIKTTDFSMKSCRNNNVREAMITMWFNTADCDIFTTLYSLSYFAEYAYCENPNMEQINKSFEIQTGGIAEAFYTMSYYHNDFESGNQYENYHDRFLGFELFWQEIMEGTFDWHIIGKNLSEHYKRTAEKMGKFHDGKWDYLYNLAKQIFEYMAQKAEITEKLIPSYQGNDKKTLREIAEVMLPELKSRLIKVHTTQRDIWFMHYKDFGWSRVEERYASVEAQCDTASYNIKRYLDGKTDKLEQLEEKRLYRMIHGFMGYAGMKF